MGFSVFLRVAIRLRSAPRWLAFALQNLLNQKAPSLLRRAKIRQAIANIMVIAKDYVAVLVIASGQISSCVRLSGA